MRIITALAISLAISLPASTVAQEPVQRVYVLPEAQVDAIARTLERQRLMIEELQRELDRVRSECGASSSDNLRSTS